MKTKEQRYVYFGEYPQTIKADDVKVTNIKDSRGYYLGSDGYYYAMLENACPYCYTSGMKGFHFVGFGYDPMERFETHDPYVHKYKFSDGRIILPKKTYFFKVEPVQWQILAEEGNVALICTDNIFAIPSKNIDDKDSDKLRKFLNKDFPGLTFSNDEIANILDFSDCSSKLLSTDAVDTVFILSEHEVTADRFGFESASEKSDSKRMKQVTDYGLASGLQINGGLYDANGKWLLRKSASSQMTHFVNFDGRSNSLAYATSAGYGIAPCLYIDIVKQGNIFETDQKNQDKRIKERIKKAKDAKIISDEYEIVINREELQNVEIAKERVFPGEIMDSRKRAYAPRQASYDFNKFDNTRPYDEENAYYDIGDDKDYYNPYLNDISEE